MPMWLFAGRTWSLVTKPWLGNTRRASAVWNIFFAYAYPGVTGTSLLHPHVAMLIDRQAQQRLDAP